MTTETDDLLVRFTDDVLARPVPAALQAARSDVLSTVGDVRVIQDASLARPWGWKGGSEDEVRYGFYRIAETYARAAIDAAGAQREAGTDRGRAADLIAPATAATWDLQGLLIPLDDATWDADPGGGEWTVRQTLGHTIAGQRGYGAGTAWWQEQAYAADDPGLPAAAPETLWEVLPSEKAEGEGTPAEVRDRLTDVLDQSTERLAGLPAERLAYGGRWSGFAVDIGFRIGRWSSHIREHTIQIEKTLVMLDHEPTEVDRLIRHLLAAWGDAESVVYGAADADAGIGVLAAAARDARGTAAEVAAISRGASED